MRRSFPLLRFGARLLIAAAAIYLGLCALLYAVQGAVLYHPSPLRVEPDARALRIAGHTGELQGWVIHPGKSLGVVYFGGNGEAVERDVDFFGRMLPDATVYLVPYRGYGPNAGTPSESAIEADALAVFDFVHAHQAHVALIGRSLGSGVATFVAARRPAERLVLVTPYDSILAIAKARYGIFPIPLLLRDRYESWRNARTIHAPTLVLLGANDAVVPRANSDALIASFPRPPKVVVIAHGDHNNLSNSPVYATTIRDFLTPPSTASPPVRPR